MQVYTVGKRSELPLRLPTGWNHIRTTTHNHQADVEYAEKQINPSENDVMVLVQITQPLREHGLLERAMLTIHQGSPCCVTATECASDSWRMMDIDGCWGAQRAEKGMAMDGQLYAWKPGHVADVFNPQTRHDVVLTNHRWGIVDVDVFEDIPPALPSMAADLLLKAMSQPSMILKNRKVLLIGSGKDLVGRGLGARIDSGEWDFVVRCNHYYGLPEDVGTRTDLAVVREAKHEKIFIDEAPLCPVRVLTTNDGVNFPKELLQEAARQVGHREASIGVIAAIWLLHHGVRLSVMGIGHFPDGHWLEQKTYPDGTPDTAGYCDWSKENAWWQRQRSVELL